MSTYSYTYLKEYLPVRYSATLEQESDRQVVYDFKDGYCSMSVKRAIVERIKLIRQCTNGSNWRICFIPVHSSFQPCKNSLPIQITSRLSPTRNRDAL